jgi:hypothetical protein
MPIAELRLFVEGFVWIISFFSRGCGSAIQQTGP